MKRFVPLFLLALFLSAVALAQSYTLTQISATKLYDSARQPLTGTIVVTLTDNTDTPVTYTPQGGSPSTATFTANVRQGVIQLVAGNLPFTVPAAATTSPAGIVYRIQTFDQSSNNIWYFPNTPINQQYYSVDGYIPQAAQPVKGYGPPSIPRCAGGAQYTDTSASTVPWACTILTQPDNTTVWTQNPSQSAQCPGMAIAYPLIGNPYCMSPALAYMLPGYVLGNNGATPGMAKPIVQPSGGGATPAGPAYAVQIANQTSSNLAADPYVTLNPTTHVLGVGTGQVAGQLQVNGGCTGTCATMTSPDGTTWNIGQNVSIPGNLTTAQLTVPACTSGQVPRGDGSGLCVQPAAAGGTNAQVQVNSGGGLAGVPATIDSSGNGTFAGYLKAKTIGGSGYVSLWGNGTTNGIATCTASGGRCIADPTYPTTEQPYLFKFFSPQISFPPVSLSSFVDQRPGNDTLLYRDAAKSAITGRNEFFIRGCGNTTVQSPTLGTGQAGASVNCYTVNHWNGAPGIDLGTPGVGPTGWSTATSLNVALQTNGAGIDGGLTINHYKAGIGDTYGSYVYSYNYGGAVAGSDEGHHLSGLYGGESSVIATGTVATGGGGSGATIVQINCLTDCNNWGDGRYLINKTTGTATGNITAKTNPSGFTPGNFTTDTPVTASTFWGTLNANVVTPAAAPLGISTTSMTFVVNSGPGNVGSPAIGDLVCFAGQFHEQSKLTNVTGTGPWTVTVPLRHAHESGSWMMSNGPCGSFLDFTANHVALAQTLRYPIDIIGATSTTTLVYRMFSYLGNTNFYPGNVLFAFSTFGSLTNTANVVTFNSVTTTSQPWLFNIPTITISASTNSAFNGACTSTVADSLGRLTCTQASSNGQTSTTATVAVGSSQYGNTAYALYPGAEVLDVLDYNSTTCAAQSPALIAPCMDSKLTLEPNTVSWNNGDSVEQPHHYLLETRAHHDTLQVFNPINPQHTDADIMTLIGNGISGGNVGQPTLNWAAKEINNQSAASTYVYHGGFVNPPGGFSLTGLFNYGLSMQYAPDPPGSPMIYAGCPISGCTDAAANYNLFTLVGNGGNAVMSYVPNTNSLTIATGTNPINISRLNVSTAVTLPNTAITAGSCTFCSVTFGADGRATSQSNNSTTAGLVVGSVGASNVSMGGLSNLVRNAATMAGGTWSTSSMTATAGQSDPYSGTNAVSLQSAASNAAYQDIGFTLTSSTSYTACGWVKGAAGGEGMQVLIGSSGVTLSTVHPITTSWQFYAIPTQAPTGSLTRTIGFFSTTATNQTVYLYGWGEVQGTSCAPWLPTGTTAVTSPTYGISTPSLTLNGNAITGPVENVVTFSATPTFSTSVTLNTITLTGNVTSSTIAAGVAGQTIKMAVCQDATGSRTFVWPTNMHGGMTIGTTASKCNAQAFTYSGNQSVWLAESQGVSNE